MEYMYDGLDVSALEAMFVKVKAHLLEANATGAVAAAKYAAWADEQVGLGQGALGGMAWRGEQRRNGQPLREHCSVRTGLVSICCLPPPHSTFQKRVCPFP